MKTDQLVALDRSLSTAARALRHAWTTMKHNGMESAAKEIADTVLDVETSSQQVRQQLDKALGN